MSRLALVVGLHVIGLIVIALIITVCTGGPK
jgi:hypothetical protein